MIIHAISSWPHWKVRSCLNLNCLLKMFWSSWLHLQVTSSSCVRFLTCYVWPVHSRLKFNTSYLYSTVFEICHKSVAWRKTGIFFAPVLITEHNCYCHLYFPYALNTEIGNHVKLIKSLSLFVLAECQPLFSAALFNLVFRFINHTAWCYQQNNEETSISNFHTATAAVQAD